MILNIALSQVGPLHYQNEIHPGQCFETTVGKVWFSVEGRIWNGENDYTYEDVALPIVNTIILSLSIGYAAIGAAIGSAAAGVESAAVEVAGTTQVLNFFGRGLAVVGSVTEQLTDGLRSPGWYFGNDRRICITGGPKSGGIKYINGQKVQIILEDGVTSFEVKDSE